MNQKIEETETNNTESVQCYLEEYRALKDEVKHHLSSMHYLTIFNLTASGAIFGYWLTDKIFLINLTLMITIISSILGMIFFYHGKRIERINSYINNIIAPRINSIANAKDLLSGDNYIRQQDESWLSWLSLEHIRISTYVITGAIALGIAMNNCLYTGFIFYVAAILLLFLIIISGFDRKSWLRKERKSS